MRDTTHPIRTTKEIKELITTIEIHREDSETAHIVETKLYMGVLKAIADGAQNPEALAQAALKAKDIGFKRWYM